MIKEARASKVEKHELTKSAVYRLGINTKFYSGCENFCKCLIRSVCTYRADAERYFVSTLKPEFNTLLGKDGYEYITYTYKSEPKYRFVFIVYVNKGSLIQESKIADALDWLIEKDKNLLEYSIEKR